MSSLTPPLFSFSDPVPPDDPVIDGGPEVLLNAGESYNLSCVSRGAKPPSVIEWLKDGLPVDGANSITVRQQENTHFQIDGISFGFRFFFWGGVWVPSGGASRQEKGDHAELPAHPAGGHRHWEELQLHGLQPGCSHWQKHHGHPQRAP